MMLLCGRKAPQTAEDVRKVEGRFLALVPHIRFHKATMNPDDSFKVTGSALARTASARTARLFAIDPGCGFDGCGIEIFLGEDCYEALCAAFDSSNVRPNIFRELSFATAATLCHELAHVVSIARFRNLYHFTTSLEDYCILESGYDREPTIFRAIFEGHLHGLVFRPWPAPAKIENYMRNCRRGAMFVREMPWGEAQVDWRVPKPYLDPVFASMTWKNMCSADNLLEPRILGCRLLPAGLVDSCDCVNCRVTRDVVQLSIKQCNSKRMSPEMIAVFARARHESPRSTARLE